MITPLLTSLIAATVGASVVQQHGSPGVTLSGVMSAPLSGDLAESARAFALSRRAELGLPPSSELGPATTFATRFGGSIHFPQQVGGFDVHGARLVVTVDSQRRVVRLASSLRPYRAAVLAWHVLAEQALRIAASEVDGALLARGGVPYGGYRRMAFSVGDEIHAGYLAHVPTLRLDESWFLGIDATDGRVLFRNNRVHHSDDADVYRASPGGLDGGVGIAPLERVSLPHLIAGRDGGFLQGERLTAYNCCPNAGCDTGPGAGPRRSTGQMSTFQGTISYDFAICDRLQRANNERAAASYVYQPVDPPRSATVSQSEPADSDEFAEVHAYHHVNRVYDYVRSLAAGGPDAGLNGFTMRDERVGKAPAVWTNVTQPDMYGAQRDAQGVLVSNTLLREDNAAFVAKENFEALFLPEYALDVDTLLIFQGDHADFAYDGTVVWHEFGHGVVYSTANFEPNVVIDSRSANEESGPLHEGVADFIAAATGQDSRVGPYVGPRAGDEDAIRDLDTDLSCPEVLWGESHQDSRHFAAALWEARRDLFQGADQGRTFDAAFYAALVSMTPAATFESAAAAIVAQVGLAFPGIPDAAQKMEDLFRRRGVIGCSKVLELEGTSGKRPYYAVLGTMEAMLSDSSPVPGPYQMKFRLPKGAKSVSIGGPYYSYGGTVRLVLLAKAGKPITFTRAGSNDLFHDADVSKVPTLSGTQMQAAAPLEIPCGGELYLTVGNTSRRGRLLQNLTVSYEPLASCPEPPKNEPSPDAGQAEPPQSLPEPVLAEAVPEDGTLGKPPSCGCSAGETGLLGLGFLAAVAFRRRRARQ
ncbi:MAG: hypothetical protein HYZ28_26640 [Myxococcales bacterium]|nr:hypothetical protein [Myxococcales bacterium]